jgi:hypothetical protein
MDALLVADRVSRAASYLVSAAAMTDAPCRQDALAAISLLVPVGVVDGAAVNAGIGIGMNAAEDVPAEDAGRLAASAGSRRGASMIASSPACSRPVT